ncbi:MAG: undecaprenyl-diphosphatase UppP [Anaerolineales bacterium]|nr:undecaprenyl-diphosphatase UppP [Anaerolineales bacterium]
MSLLQAAILGLVQGLTEFLPISSSGHLVIVPALLGWNIPEEQVFVFDVLVQLGTLVAVIVYFWKDLFDILSNFIKGLVQREPFATQEARIGWYLILATIPAGLGGLMIKDIIEESFSKTIYTGIALILTALVLIAAESIGKQTVSMENITWKESLVMGFFQLFAVFPGISRSGSTITGGMISGLKRSASARFSFLMSVPVMLAAGLLAVLDLFQVPDLNLFILPLLIGFVVSAIVGYLSIRWLLAYLVNHQLWVFSIYLFIVGSITLIFL